MKLLSYLKTSRAYLSVIIDEKEKSSHLENFAFAISALVLKNRKSNLLLS